jgi:predicted acyltransferase
VEWFVHASDGGTRFSDAGDVVVVCGCARVQEGGKPLLIVGMNSMAVYLASEILAEVLDNLHAGSRGASLHQLFYSRFFAPLSSMENASLLWALSFTGLMYLWAYFLYKKSWFWRI